MKLKGYRFTLKRVSKLMFFVSAVFLIAVAALRFTVVGSQSVHDAIMNFYYLFFGVALSL